MKALHSLLVACFALAALPAGAVAADSGRDVHSFAEPDKVVTEHIHLDLDVDFAAKQLRGSATLSLKRIASGYDQLVLDTRELSISKVEAAAPNGAFQNVSFTLDKADPALGSALRITLPKDAKSVKVTY